MIQSVLGGSTAQEERFLMNELARRLILSGLSISNTGVFSFTVPFIDASALTGVVAVAHGGTGLATVAANRILYASATDVIAALPTVINSILQTNGSGVPAWSATLPSGITLTAPVFSGSIGSDLLFTDGLYDIGKSAATRPRDLFLSRNGVIGGTLSVTGTSTLAAVNGTIGNFSGTLDVQGTVTLSTLLNVSGAVTLSSTVTTPKIFAGICQGRLTLTAGTPVTTADVTGATNVFWTPNAGNAIALYNGSTNWTLMSFVETTLALGTLTNDLPYDVFAFNNAGTLNLEALAWSTKTARATALVLQDGVLVKSGATTRRYLGTFKTTSTTTTEDSYAKRDLYNFYGQTKRPMRVLEATDTWGYATATIRQANGSTANQLEVMIGVAGEAITVTIHAILTTNTPGNDTYSYIGEDSTTTPSSSALHGRHDAPTVGFMSNEAFLETIPALGLRQFMWLEKGAGAGTVTWYGDNGTPGAMQSGIVGSIRM